MPILVEGSMLTDARQDRLTAKEAMAHPYFAPIRDEASLATYLNGATVSSAS